MSLEESIEARILKYLYLLETENLTEKAYKREIARNIGASERAVYTYLQRLRKKGYIELSGQKGVQRFYKLTDTGRALAWALLNPDALAALYKQEVTARSVGARQPSVEEMLSPVQFYLDLVESMLREHLTSKVPIVTDVFLRESFSRLQEMKTILQNNLRRLDDVLDSLRYFIEE